MKQILISLLLLIGFTAFAQEQLVPLGANPALIRAEKPKLSKQLTKGAGVAVKLPFIDDFSRAGVYPQQQLWIDRYVFVNKSFAVNPPSFGVATFDAMNDTGGVYNNMSTFPTIADTLTSQPIRLDSNFINNSTLSPADSVYLSFYIQPQGMGDAPQLEDSLVLQFYNPKDDKWSSVWNMEGMRLDTFITRYGTDFLQVLIPITDSDYFSPNFQFRFYNYASIPGLNIPSWRSGMYDHWNLDYVLLNIHRTYDDIYSNDVCVSKHPTTLLANYQSMPWNQFLANTNAEMDHTKDIELSRLDFINGPINVAQFFGITNLDDKTEFHPPSNPSSINMNTRTKIFLPNYTSYSYNSNASPYADFLVEYRVLHIPDIIRSNDTLKFFQRFYNYYAYDDGVPEAGYGLSTSSGQLAVQFKTNTADSIQSVQFFFNQTLGWANQQYFDIQIWDDNGGTPGSVIYTQKSVRPEFSSSLFKFQTYILDNAVAVNGVFYVGWKQSTQDNLNVGWDYNNNKSDKVFYNVTGNWYNSSFDGIAMIRPIMGTEDLAYVGISQQKQDDGFGLLIAPNPVQSNVMHLQLDANEALNYAQYRIRIFNMSGQLIAEKPYDNNIDVSNLQSGIYLIQVFSLDGKHHINKKFIVNK
jgi:hypothetical protein